MYLPVLALLSVASASAVLLSERQLFIYPLVQILPVTGYNTTTDGFNSLATIYNNSADQLSVQATAIGKM